MGGQFWFWHFQNIQCQWFQVHIGADGRTSGGGAADDDPGLHERARGVRAAPGVQFQNGPPAQLVVAMPSSMLP